ncbi:MAG: phage protein Gp36 family protein [Bacillota bacterium]
MSYSTVAEVRRALVPTLSNTDAADPPTNASRTAADFTNDQLQDAIAEADAVIDGYIGRFYAVPVQQIPDPATQPPGSGALIVPHPLDYWSRNIAAYNATLVYRGSLDFTDNDPVARRYKDTLFALQQVAAGKMQIQYIAENTSETAATGAGSAINPYIGDLFTIDEFDLKAPRTDPVYGVNPLGGLYPGYPR